MVVADVKANTGGGGGGLCQGCASCDFSGLLLPGAVLRQLKASCPLCPPSPLLPGGPNLTLPPQLWKPLWPGALLSCLPTLQVLPLYQLRAVPES